MFDSRMYIRLILLVRVFWILMRLLLRSSLGISGASGHDRQPQRRPRPLSVIALSRDVALVLSVQDNVADMDCL